MPIIKSARKKLRVDKRRAIYNLSIKNDLKSLLRKAEEQLSLTLVKDAISALDKAAQKGIIHRNTAGRKKSSLMKKISGKQAKKTKSATSKSLKPRVTKSITKKAKK